MNKNSEYKDPYDDTELMGGPVEIISLTDLQNRQRLERHHQRIKEERTERARQVSEMTLRKNQKWLRNFLVGYVIFCAAIITLAIVYWQEIGRAIGI